MCYFQFKLHVAKLCQHPVIYQRKQQSNTFCLLESSLWFYISIELVFNGISLHSVENGCILNSNSFCKTTDIIRSKLMGLDDFRFTRFWNYCDVWHFSVLNVKLNNWVRYISSFLSSSIKMCPEIKLKSGAFLWFRIV